MKTIACIFSPISIVYVVYFAYAYKCMGEGSWTHYDQSQSFLVAAALFIAYKLDTRELK